VATIYKNSEVSITIVPITSSLKYTSRQPIVNTGKVNSPIIVSIILNSDIVIDFIISTQR
jgi:hypothetical protein